MADCKELDAALANLSSKIDGFGNKLNDLSNRLNDLDRKQKECCDKKQDNKNNQSLEGILRRLTDLEKDMSIVGKFLSTYVEPVLAVMKELVPFGNRI